LTQGQRIASYTVSAQDAIGGAWQTIANGKTIGSTRIDRIGFGTGTPPTRPPARVAKALRVNITAVISDDGALPGLRVAGVYLPPLE
jgi:hypothetical protein